MPLQIESQIHISHVGNECLHLSLLANQCPLIGIPMMFGITMAVQDDMSKRATARVDALLRINFLLSQCQC